MPETRSSTPDSLPALESLDALTLDTRPTPGQFTYVLPTTTTSAQPTIPRRSAPARTSNMAIDRYIPYPEAHDLARTQKGFYPVRIPVSHWQLRHYISTPEEDHLYYASGNDIYCLNTKTKKRKHIAALPFEARCTASGFGWVCVGGEEEGHFAAIKLERASHEVDDGLPIDGRRQGGNNVPERRAPTVRVEKIGEEIVNSISIHRIQDEEAHLDDIVAVLTNNDKTVRVYSLPAGQETRVKDLPFAINHATISPDGTMLIAVGDYNQAYFFTREIMDTPPQIPKPHNRLTSASLEWRLTNVVTLHVTDLTVGYFTTCWSPSGHLVAVGSEGGYITVMDTAILTDNECEDDDSIVAVVPGSRADLPSPHPGAIRSMMFSPEPWELLIWAEDQGRICVGDLRTGLKSRQIISLEPKDESLDEHILEELPGEDTRIPHIDELEADLLQRYRDSPDNTSAVNFATEYIEARRRQRQHRQDLANQRSQSGTPSSRRNVGGDYDGDDPGGLTAREQQILESLRTSRLREEARSYGHTPRSVNYTSPDMFTATNSRSSGTASNTITGESGRPISEILNSVQESFPELSRTNAISPDPSSSHEAEPPSTLPPLRALQEGVWGSSARSGLPRLGDTSRLPRRRQSGVLSPPTSNGGSSSRASATAYATEPEDDNPWRTIEEYMAAARGPLFEGAARAPPQPTSPLPAPTTLESLQSDLDAQRRISAAQARARERWRNSRLGGNAAASASATAEREARRLAPFPEGYDALLRLQSRTQLRGYSGREVGVRTAGLAMSPDGRLLWAACEEGIFEIQVGRKGRMFWPAVQPR
ncbi:uncharacterized protein CLAFUR5_08061 [Fulvia fulva]|uniref:DUF2415 domain-containing protein n=1 Tax=Passalora fulva TaxID=5499 RepID=A0A9Q8LC89_PASFU|nr:uncharacterized protein CLAFUR5_08061 [Fulvia fulva]UJO14726.1 hypothetical protein CLAFUR5_08061 [Fulvia fulva]